MPRYRRGDLPPPVVLVGAGGEKKAGERGTLAAEDDFSRRKIAGEYFCVRVGKRGGGRN